MTVSLLGGSSVGKSCYNNQDDYSETEWHRAKKKTEARLKQIERQKAKSRGTPQETGSDLQPMDKGP